MAETFESFFTALLFGGGNLIGLLAIVAICLLLLLAWKYSAVLTLPISLLLAINYITNDLIWNAVIMCAYAIFSLIYLTQKVKQK